MLGPTAFPPVTPKSGVRDRIAPERYAEGNPWRELARAAAKRQHGRLDGVVMRDRPPQVSVKGEGRPANLTRIALHHQSTTVSAIVRPAVRRSLVHREKPEGDIRFGRPVADSGAVGEPVFDGERADAGKFADVGRHQRRI